MVDRVASRLIKKKKMSGGALADIQNRFFLVVSHGICGSAKQKNVTLNSEQVE